MLDAFCPIIIDKYVRTYNIYVRSTYENLSTYLPTLFDYQNYNSITWIAQSYFACFQQMHIIISLIH
jgi:hypothetical protein